MDKKLTSLSLNKNNIDSPFINFERKNHPPYGSEEVKIYPLTSPKYNDEIVFDIPLIGDLIYKSFIEVKIPKLDFPDNEKFIGDKFNDYNNYKNNLLNNYKLKVEELTTKYNNLYNYCNIQLLVYIEVRSLLKISNFTIDFLKKKVLILINKYDNLYNYQLLVDSKILNEINLIGYINSINISDPPFNIDINADVNLVLDIINKKIEKIHNNINNYLHHYYSYKLYYNKKIINLENKKIDYKWINYLSHYYFTNFELNIDGQTIDQYSSDNLHIETLSKIHEDYLHTYNLLSRNNNSIYETSNAPKSLYIPLKFFFCKKVTDALPLISLQNSSINIKLKINKLNNLIYFKDLENDFYNNLVIEILREEHTINSNNTIIEKDFSPFTYESLSVSIPEYIYKYKFKNINKFVLDYNYKGIDSDAILEQYGINDENGNKILTLNEWIYMKNNIKNNATISDNTKIAILDYYYFVDFNFVQNFIPNPDISLITTYLYLDDIEKFNFTKNRLTYLISTTHEITHELVNNSYFDYVNNIDGLVYSFYYFVRPILIKNGFDKYSKKEYSNFYNYNILSSNLIDEIKFEVANEYNLIEFRNDNYSYFIGLKNFTGKLPDGVYSKLFNIDYNSSNPTGTINMTNVKGQNINVILNDNSFNEYINNKNNLNKLGVEFKLIYKKYNKIEISNGKFELKYYT